MRLAARALLGDLRADVVERARVHEVGAARVEGAQERVQVAVGDARDHGRAAEVDDLGGRAGEVAHRRVVADRDDLLAGHGDGGRLGRAGVERADAAVDEGEGHSGGHGAVPSVGTRTARVGFQPGRGTLARSSWV